MPATTVHSASFDADTVAPDVAKAAARFVELAHSAMQHADNMLRLDDEVSEADRDLAFFAMFAADVIHGEGIGMDMADVVAAFRAIGAAERVAP
jgi:hypothetical protein